MSEAEALGKLGDHINYVVSFYKSQCDAFCASADKHLKGLVEYTPPTAGMFVWMKLVGIQDSFKLIKEKAVAEKVRIRFSHHHCHPSHMCHHVC